MFSLYPWGCESDMILSVMTPILRILRGTCRINLFMEVTNLMKGNTIWTHYTLTDYYPTLIKLS